MTKRRQLAAGAVLAAYVLYELRVNRFFSPTIPPAYYRDLGALWNLADFVVAHHQYQVGAYYFPPSNAILMHAVGSLDRTIAYRALLVFDALALALTLWAWSRLTEIAGERRPLVVVCACAAAHAYVRLDFHMHNVNLICLALVSLAVALERWPMSSGACYSLSVAIKPYGNVLLLPLMARRRRTAITAVLGIAVFYGVMPGLSFGRDAPQLYRQWIASVAQGATDTATPLSVHAGIAALGGSSLDTAAVTRATWVLSVVYAAALVVFLCRARSGGSTEVKLDGPADIAALLLAPLPIGALQQPARAVALLPALVIVAAAAVDTRRTAVARATLASVVGTIGVCSHVVPLGPVHALLTLPLCLLVIVGLRVATSPAWPTESHSGRADDEPEGGETQPQNTATTAYATTAPPTRSLT